VAMASLKDLIALKDEVTDRFLTPAAATRSYREPSGTTLLLAAAVKQAKAPVHAIGVGKMRVDGKAVGELCIRFYVAQKLPLDLIPAGAALPRQLDGIPTDVIESPPALVAAAKAAACTTNRQARQRPIVGGISVAHVAVTAGTIGYFCRSTDDADDPDARFVLSNNHILAKVNKGRRGDAVVQPGPIDGGTSADRVASLTRFQRISLSATARNRVDAAIARIDDGVQFQAAICSIGKVAGTAVAAEEMRVQKHGRTTGYREGEMTDISLNTTVGGLDPANPSTLARFIDQVRIDRINPYPDFALQGDSGALVVTTDAKPKAVGLFFACPVNGSYGVANKIDDVLSKLKIALV
jgi:hypothetical protein